MYTRIPGIFLNLILLIIPNVNVLKTFTEIIKQKISIEDSFFLKVVKQYELSNLEVRLVILIKTIISVNLHNY